MFPKAQHVSRVSQVMTILRGSQLKGRSRHEAEGEGTGHALVWFLPYTRCKQHVYWLSDPLVGPTSLWQQTELSYPEPERFSVRCHLGSPSGSVLDHVNTLHESW